MTDDSCKDVPKPHKKPDPNRLDDDVAPRFKKPPPVKFDTRPSHPPVRTADELNAIIERLGREGSLSAPSGPGGSESPTFKKVPLDSDDHPFKVPDYVPHDKAPAYTPPKRQAQDPVSDCAKKLLVSGLTPDASNEMVKPNGARPAGPRAIS